MKRFYALIALIIGCITTIKEDLDPYAAPYLVQLLEEYKTENQCSQ